MSEQPEQPDGMLDDDGERMIPAFHRGGLIYAEHLTRYLVAQELVRGKRVLDIASGSGYGSQLLAETAASVIGVDRDERAVAYATATYGGADHLEFRQGDATQIPVEDGSVDVLITFETIEHVEDYRAFMREIDRVLAPEGLAVISTPNDLEFAEGNHFHLHEFVLDELLELVGEHFDHVVPYFQGTWKAVAISTLEELGSEGPLEAPVVNLSPLVTEQLLYFYLLCSRRPVTERVEPLVALGGHYSDRAILGHSEAQSRTIEELGARVAELSERLERTSTRLAEREGELELLQRSRALRVARGVRSLLGRGGH